MMAVPNSSVSVSHDSVTVSQQEHTLKLKEQNVNQPSLKQHYVTILPEAQISLMLF